MDILIIQKEAFEEMAAKFSRFTERVDALLAKQGGKSLNGWMDNQEVCRQLNISPRTLQTLRDNGTLAYSQIGHKIFYKPEDTAYRSTRGGQTRRCSPPGQDHLNGIKLIVPLNPM